MGLSRNKVAVSEGAAGSPPFYGESSQVEIPRDKFERETITVHLTNRTEKRNTSMSGSELSQSLFDFQGPIRNPEKLKKLRGCSSVGRAPALQAGGQEFESLHLHHGWEKPIGKNTERAHSSAG